MKKTFVLDTNVLLHDPSALFAFADNDVVIPIYVIEEIDTFKKDLSELGRNARQIARNLDALRSEGCLSHKVELPQGGFLQVALNTQPLPECYCTDSKTDNLILATALQFHHLAKMEGNRTTIFVTKDINLRIRADALGLRVEDYDSERTDINELYTGIGTIDVSPEDFMAYQNQGCLPLPDPYYYPNQFIILRDKSDSNRTQIGKVNLQELEIQSLSPLKNSLWGIRPRNREQTFAFDILMDDNIKLVTLLGKAGTGKTLMAIAAGLQKVTEEQAHQRLLISRPIFPLGRDIGFLPGDIEEKLTPWMQPIFDNVEFLMGLSRGDRKNGRSYTELMDLGILEIEPLTYIRGRSIPNQFMVVDEAQNLTPHEIKTIISRVGDNTKIILTGDPHQIDNPYVDATNNGLVHAVNCFRTESIAGHISLEKGERSQLAELAANLL
jgi:PhoH-like ATPase